MNNFQQYNDEQLIGIIKRKKKDAGAAFNALYNRYADKVHAYCLFKCSNILDAEEIFQDAWLKFYRAIEKEDKIRSTPALLYQIARNISIDKFRVKENNIMINFGDFDFNEIANPFNLQTDIENSELMELIGLAANSLSDIYKEVFVLVWFSGLSYQEVSKIIGETVDCVKKRAYRAMDEVIHILKPIKIEISQNE